jgi:hypothetical protein
MKSNDNQIKKSSLPKGLIRKIKFKEEHLSETLWSFVNPNKEKILFGRFGKLKGDNTIVTLAFADYKLDGNWNWL